MRRAVFMTVRYISFATSIVVFLFGVFLNDISLLNYSVFLMWINNVCYAIEDFYERIFFFAFQITFFTFLMGRTVSGLFLIKKDYYNFSNDILMHTEICLFTALISLYVGYFLFTKVCLTKHKTLQVIDYESPKYHLTRQISKYLFWCMLPFSMLVIAEKAIFVRTMGYADYYVEYTSRFPYFVTKFGDICPLAFYIFLATMPSKKEIKVPLLFFVLRAVSLMFTGKRADFVVPVLVLILYFARRNDIHPGGERWLSKKHLRCIAVCVPFLLVVLNLYNTIRFDSSNNSSSSSFLEGILNFFDNTGFSVNVISFEKKYEDSIPDKIYSFGDTVDYLRENFITQVFFEFPVYKTQTAEKALYGNNFSQTLTYIHSPSYYLSGRGYGSSYIAEAYHDFGYFGIVLWSFIYSYMLAKVYSFQGRGIVYISMALQALRYILMAPRNMASAFISEYINVYTWMIIVAVTLAVRFILETKHVKDSAGKKY